MIRAVLLALLLTGCTNPPTRPILPVVQYEPYPIHLRWWICNNLKDRLCTASLREVIADSIPAVLVEGLNMAANDVAQLLSPTMAGPFIIPTEGGRHYQWQCWGKDAHLETGDTIPAGLTIHIRFMPDWHTPAYGAAAGGCGHGRSATVWIDKPVMGVIFIPCERCDQTDGVPAGHSAEQWRRTLLHEMAHIMGAAGADRFAMDTTGGYSVVTDSVIVAAFDRAGGADYPGKKVPMFDSGHWHRCIGSGDVLAGSEKPHSRITDLTIAAFWPGFITEARGGLDSPKDQMWAACPEFKDDTGYISDLPVNDWLGFNLPPY